ncbi:MAG: hypothetical protein ACK4NW_13720 [Roseinatronobacter sp.]
MARKLSELRARGAAPGCRLLEDLDALRQLEGALEIIEAREARSAIGGGFPFGLRRRDSGGVLSGGATERDRAVPHPGQLLGVWASGAGSREVYGRDA